MALDEYQAKERKTLLWHNIIFVSLSIVLILPVIVVEQYCREGMDCSARARDERTELWLRPTQFITYFILALASLVVSIIFIMRIKRYMYLYYDEYRK